MDHLTKTTFKVTSRYKRMLADIITPVSIFLRIRDRYLNSILLESADYHGNENSFSYICFDPVARFDYTNDQLTVKMPICQDKRLFNKAKLVSHSLQMAFLVTLGFLLFKVLKILR
jgi:anthranilate/para-aminobenzoate synthase component I